MAEARAPQKSLPKINPVDRPFWEGAAKNKFLTAEMQILRQSAVLPARRLRRLLW